MTSLYCGIDFHKNTSTFCVINEKGDIVEKPTTVKSNNLVNFLSNRRFERIGIEASGGVYHIVDQLKASGHPSVDIINPAKFRAIGFNGKKTDDKDAFHLAEILRVNYIPLVYHKSKKAREIKILLNQREIIVRSRCNFTNHIRGTLREFGIAMPAGKEHFFEEVDVCINKIEIPMIQENLRSELKLAKEMIIEEEKITKQLEILGNETEGVQLLLTVPGIGIMSAMALTSIIDDYGRFKNGNFFASYLGLTPRESSSGDKKIMGSITRSGPEMVRRYLIHGARAVLSTIKAEGSETDINRRWAARLKVRVGFNKAVVALAHRHAKICFAMLRDNVCYHAKNIQLQEVGNAKYAA